MLATLCSKLLNRAYLVFINPFSTNKAGTVMSKGYECGQGFWWHNQKFQRAWENLNRLGYADNLLIDGSSISYWVMVKDSLHSKVPPKQYRIFFLTVSTLIALQGVISLKNKYYPRMSLPLSSIAELFFLDYFYQMFIILLNSFVIFCYYSL